MNQKLLTQQRQLIKSNIKLVREATMTCHESGAPHKTVVIRFVRADRAPSSTSKTVRHAVSAASRIVRRANVLQSLPETLDTRGALRSDVIRDPIIDNHRNPIDGPPSSDAD